MLFLESIVTLHTRRWCTFPVVSDVCRCSCQLRFKTKPRRWRPKIKTEQSPLICLVWGVPEFRTPRGYLPRGKSPTTRQHAREPHSYRTSKWRMVEIIALIKDLLHLHQSSEERLHPSLQGSSKAGWLWMSACPDVWSMGNRDGRNRYQTWMCRYQFGGRCFLRLIRLNELITPPQRDALITSARHAERGSPLSYTLPITRLYVWCK